LSEAQKRLAEEEFRLTREQRRLMEDREKFEREQRKNRESEQNLILGRKNTRPKLSFSLNSSK
ncbi:unnamed protein product, partial [Didymodactylos carnosus]